MRKSPTTIAVLTTFAKFSGVLARLSRARKLVAMDQGEDLRRERAIEFQRCERLVAEM